MSSASHWETKLTRTDALKVISGQGMPSYRHHEPGDLYVRIAVKFPENMVTDVIPLLEKALPARQLVSKAKKGTVVDEVMLEEPNDRQRRSAAANGDEMDEDDEDGRPQGVQCAQRMFLPGFGIKLIRGRMSATEGYVGCRSRCWAHRFYSAFFTANIWL